MASSFKKKRVSGFKSPLNQNGQFLFFFFVVVFFFNGIL